MDSSSGFNGTSLVRRAPCVLVSDVMPCRGKE
jgi:hypothetical protein